MKIIAIASVTAGGKTTLVNEIKRQVENVESLHFGDYSFQGEVDDFHARIAYVQMLKDILPSSDYVIDGTKELEEKVEEMKKIMSLI